MGIGTWLVIGRRCFEFLKNNNIGDDEGFIIVSGDDVAPPVLGYSVESSYNGADVPPNFAQWMAGIQKSISVAVAKKMAPTRKVASYWEDYLNEDAASITVGRAEDALVTTLWGQRHPYHLYCPVFDGDTSVTGCVATATAQIMNYHRHPIKGNGVIPSYITTTNQYVVPDIDISDVEYNWDAMLDVYDGNATEEEKAAVAQLMYHCGASVKMNYTPSASGAASHYVISALPKFFGYDNAIQLTYRWNYGDDDWKWMELIAKEIDMKRPVYYAASDQDGTGAHAFVCDGYDPNYYFHINWGWNGTYNGYFWLDELTPGTYNYSVQHNAIFGLQPDIGSEEFFPLQLTWGTDLSASTTSVSQGGTVDFYFSLNNNPGVTVNGMLGIAFVDENDNILYTQKIKTIELLAGYIYCLPEVELTCQIPNNFESGNYLVRIAVNDQDGWHLIKNPSGSIDVLPLQIGTLGIGEAKEMDKIVIYPNPTGGELKVTCYRHCGLDPQSTENEKIAGQARNDIRSVDIFDMLGKRQFSTFNFQLSTLDISSLPSGVYFIRIQTENGVVVRKVVKE